jgi:hypothetical protein
MARRYDFGERRQPKKPVRDAPRKKVPGRGAWRYRVVFRREGWVQKIKTFGTEKRAVRYYKMLMSATPWVHFGREADDEHQCRRSSADCLCNQGTPVNGERLGTFAHYNRMVRLAWPPLEYCRLEASWMQPWQPYVLAWEPETLPEPVPIVDPRRLLTGPRFIEWTEEPEDDDDIPF